LGDENGQASFGLANNLPANNAGNRFHAEGYGLGDEKGQGSELPEMPLPGTQKF
jgi:hypothetical protein